MFKLIAQAGDTRVVLEKLQNSDSCAMAFEAYGEVFSDESFEKLSHTVQFDRETGEHVALPLDGELKLIVELDGVIIPDILDYVRNDSGFIPKPLAPFAPVPVFKQAEATS